MYNQTKTVYNRIKLPKEEPKASGAKGLLAPRMGKAKPKESTPAERIAKYVADIRKSREQFKNGK
jgi:hypothetical protein